ncbi:TIGR04104 family putative zinc finger protein [Geomicrobium sp. JSM 1781026]|uniref:TIGR04104 family putative zinc finger protein n=1 Tax=Geomicrobium sp. JSM 1781026 TaxID=3344580 RepID=UPI0035C1292C
MRLPTCWNCTNTFRWRQCIGKYDRLVCDLCSEENFLSSKGQWRMFFPYVPIFLLPVSWRPFFDDPFYYSVIFIVVFVILNHFFIQPFLLHYRKEKEYLIDGFS